MVDCETHRRQPVSSRDAEICVGSGNACDRILNLEVFYVCGPYQFAQLFVFKYLEPFQVRQ